MEIFLSNNGDFMKFFRILLATFFTFFSLHSAWVLPPLDVADGGDPAVGVCDTANAVVAFANAGSTAMQASTFDGVSWTTPVTITDSGLLAGGIGTDISTVGSTCNSAAVWTSSDGTNNRIKASIYNGTTWSAAVILSDPGFSSNLAQVSIDSSGNAVAIWNRSDVVVRASFYNGTSWSAPVDISATSTGAFARALDTDNQGNFYALWQISDGTNIITQTATFNGTTWSSPIDLSSAGINSISLDISVNDLGEAVALYWEQGVNTLVYARMNSGSTWTMAELISTPGVNTRHCSVSINNSGNIIVAMLRLDVAQLEVTNFNGSTWSTPQFLGNTVAQDIFPDVDLSNSGTGVAVWEGTNGTDDITQAAIFDGSDWSTPEDLSEAGEDAVQQTVGIDSFGNAIATWQTSGVVVQSSAFLLKPASPTNFQGFIVENRFLTQTDTINKLSWTASISATTVGYRIYQNGVVVAQTPATGPFAVELHNRIKGLTNTYSLVAFDSTGTESDPVVLIL